MTEKSKEQIIALLKGKIQNLGISNNEFARRNKDVISAANLSIMLSEDQKWRSHSISDKLWNAVASLVGFTAREWTLIQTANYLKVTAVCEDAQQNSRFLAIAAFTGAGKSAALRKYAEKHPNVFYVHCNKGMGKKQFLNAILRAMGMEIEGSIYDRIDAICRRLKTLESPLLILDDFGKIGDEIKLLVQIIYDETEFVAGIIIAGTEALKKGIDKMAAKDKIGFRELKSRIGHWQPLYRPSKKAITEICSLNNIADEQAIKTIFNKIDNYRSLRNLVENANRVSRRTGKPVTAETIIGLQVEESQVFND